MSAPDPQAGHERQDAPVGLVFWSLIILSLTCLVSAFVGYGIHVFYMKYEGPHLPAMSPMAQMQRLPPEPRLQVDDASDLMHLRQAEDAILNSYGWVDPQAGRVRIPVGRAIDLMAERGLPTRKGGTEQ